LSENGNMIGKRGEVFVDRKATGAGKPPRPQGGKKVKILRESMWTFNLARPG